ncbi:tetratricopeptide repeat protein [Geobacter pickeringii]|uniref:Uncharacterized protein n=1 Tax=Geobacter pickeringii TaxID=345632 RepID=A0A0B5B7R1_9BACT|nr:tetratricopeptide repeat protein [Geobacter pickeringii]AJE02568.1 hypothetical protein GPICK_03520 [Geobacter pickeringii]
MEGSAHPQGTTAAGKNITALLAALVFAVSAAAYAITLRNGFVWDDVGTLTDGTAATVRNLWEVIVRGIGGPVEGIGYYRPLIGILNTLVRIVFGDDPRGFHLLNVAVHAAVATASFGVLLRLLAGNGPATRRDGVISCAGALLFSLHPVHAESVAWASGITDPAYSFFYLSAFYFYLAALGEHTRPPRRTAFSLVSLACFLVATLAKEPALTLPLLLMAHDGAFPERLHVRSLTEFLKRHGPYLAVAALALLLRAHALAGLHLGGESQHLPLAGDGRTLDTVGYAINALPLFVKYLGTLLLPVNLSAYYEVRLISSLAEPAALLSLLATLCFIAFSGVAWHRNRPLFFALAAMTIPLLPALNFRATGTTAFAERYLYLPSFGFVLALVFPAADLWRKNAQSARYLAAAGAGILVAYAAITIPRGAVWRDNYTLWADTVRKFPNSGMVHYNLAYELKQRGELREAIAQYRTAIDLSPGLADAHMNLGNIYAQTGFPGMAIDEYRATLRIRPNYGDAFFNLGRTCFVQGKTRESIDALSRAVAITPDNPMAHNTLGMAYQQAGAPDKAREEFLAAVRLNPGESRYRVNLDAAIQRHN